MAVGDQMAMFDDELMEELLEAPATPEERRRVVQQLEREMERWVPAQYLEEPGPIQRQGLRWHAGGWRRHNLISTRTMVFMMVASSGSMGLTAKEVREHSDRLWGPSAPITTAARLSELKEAKVLFISGRHQQGKREVQVYRAYPEWVRLLYWVKEANGG